MHTFQKVFALITEVFLINIFENWTTEQQNKGFLTDLWLYVV